VSFEEAAQLGVGLYRLAMPASELELPSPFEGGPVISNRNIPQLGWVAIVGWTICHSGSQS